MSSFTSCNSSSSSSIWWNHNMCLRELLEVVASMHAKPLHFPKKTGRFSVVQAHIDFTPGLLEQRISRSWLTFFLHPIMEKSPRMISPPYWRQITSFCHRKIRNSPLHSLGGGNSIYKGSPLLAITPPASKTVHFIRATWQQLYHQLARRVLHSSSSSVLCGLLSSPPTSKTRRRHEGSNC